MEARWLVRAIARPGTWSVSVCLSVWVSGYPSLLTNYYNPSSHLTEPMVATWLKLALVCLSARGGACFDAGGDVPGSPGNLADAMRGAAWPASLSAPHTCTTESWACLGRSRGGAAGAEDAAEPDGDAADESDDAGPVGEAADAEDALEARSRLGH